MDWEEALGGPRTEAVAIASEALGGTIGQPGTVAQHPLDAEPYATARQQAIDAARALTEAIPDWPDLHEQLTAEQAELVDAKISAEWEWFEVNRSYGAR